MSSLTPFLAIIFPASTAWSQTPQAASNPDSAAGTDYIATGGVTNYWWIFLLVVVLAVVVGTGIWFVSRRRG